MRYLVYIILIFGTLFMGCASQKRCFDKFPPEVKSDTVEIFEVEYRDTIVEVFIPGDTIYEEVAIAIPHEDPEDSVVLIPDPSFYKDTVRAVGDHSEAKAWIDQRRLGPAKLKLELIEHDLNLQIKLDSAILEARHWKTMYQVEIHKSPPERKIPWYYRASLPVAIILFLMLLFCIRYRR